MFNMTQIDGRIQKKLFERIRFQNREPNGDVLGPVLEDKPAFLHDALARTCWVRVISAVPSVEEDGHHRKIFRLSSAFNYDANEKSFTPKNEPLASRGGFATEGGTYRPHAGITGITTEFQNHSIQDITITWKFHNKEKFDEYQNALLKHGRAILVEFGWGDPNNQQGEEQIKDPEDMLAYFESITKKILDRGGDYYAACGVVSGFTWDIGEGGAFECTTTVTSMGTSIFKSQINKNTKDWYGDLGSQNKEKTLEAAYNKSNFSFANFMTQLNEIIGALGGFVSTDIFNTSLNTNEHWRGGGHLREGDLELSEIAHQRYLDNQNSQAKIQLNKYPEVRVLPKNKEALVRAHIKSAEKSKGSLAGHRGGTRGDTSGPQIGIGKDGAWPQIGDNTYVNNKVYTMTANGWVEE